MMNRVSSDASQGYERLGKCTEQGFLLRMMGGRAQPLG